MEFYHKDEFLKEYNSKWLPSYEFPIILIVDGEVMESIITSQDFNDITTVEALMQVLKDLKW